MSYLIGKSIILNDKHEQPEYAQSGRQQKLYSHGHEHEIFYAGTHTNNGKFYLKKLKNNHNIHTHTLELNMIFHSFIIFFFISYTTHISFIQSN